MLLNEAQRVGVDPPANGLPDPQGLAAAIVEVGDWLNAQSNQYKD